MLRHARGCRTARSAKTSQGKGLERPSAERERRVPEDKFSRSGILSRAGPEESCLKPAAPSAKAKYSWETDSEQVP